jgi:transposase
VVVLALVGVAGDHWWVAFDYVRVDRDQQFLMPPSVREWLPEDHLVWFVIDVVDRVDTSVLHAAHPRGGAGRRAFDPDMMLALLVYAYCTGERSSRQIERLCVVDVAYRVVCANVRPDHTTIARFRQAHQGEAVRLFTDVLALCAQVDLVSVGVIAVDGTKIAGVASKKANRTRAQIEAEVTAMFAEADAVDAAEDALFGDRRGDELPAGLADPRSRKARLDAAVVELERQRRQRELEQRQASDDRARVEAAAASKGHNVKGRPPKGREVEVAEAALERVVTRERERRERIEAEAAAKGHKIGGRTPTPGRGRIGAAERRVERAREREAQRAKEPQKAKPAPDPAEAGRVNVTDIDSRLMKTQGGWIQGFNAQAAVTDAGIVVAADVTQDPFDVGQCEPMMAATQANLVAVGVTDTIGMMLFDAGYLSEANVTAAGPPRLIATGKAWKHRRESPTSGEPPDGLSPVEAMEHRLRTPDGAALYAKRQHTVEPVFGTIKETRGYRRFTRRGIDAVKAEWQLITAAHNINKLHRHAH